MVIFQQSPGPVFKAVNPPLNNNYRSPIQLYISKVPASKISTNE